MVTKSLQVYDIPKNTDCPMLSLTFFKISQSKYITMTLTFRVTWSHNWVCISSHFLR